MAFLAAQAGMTMTTPFVACTSCRLLIAVIPRSFDEKILTHCFQLLPQIYFFNLLLNALILTSITPLPFLFCHYSLFSQYA